MITTDQLLEYAYNMAFVRDRWQEAQLASSRHQFFGRAAGQQEPGRSGTDPRPRGGRPMMDGPSR